MNTSYRVYFFDELKGFLKNIVTLAIGIAVLAAMLIGLLHLVMAYAGHWVFWAIVVPVFFLLYVAGKANQRCQRDQGRRLPKRSERKRELD